MDISVKRLLTTRGSVRGRGKQGKVSRRNVVISNNNWQAAIFRAKGQPHFVGLTVSVGWINNKAGQLKHIHQRCIIIYIYKKKNKTLLSA